MKNGNYYVLGTGLSHDGSACLLKNGRVAVAIEKERLTRVKHDGLNDSAAIKYCLEAENISIEDLDLVVQNAIFHGNFSAGNDYFCGERPFKKTNFQIPIVTISHHLAHAYSAIGTCPFDDCDVFVLDGCGNSFDLCLDLETAEIPDREQIVNGLSHLYHEKDSFYSYSNGKLRTLYKDFSELGYIFRDLAMHPSETMHSIGGLYSAVSRYCFGSMDDPGKLMGLAPYGKRGVYKGSIFECKEGRVFVNYSWMEDFCNPSRSYSQFKANFQYYADIANWVQLEVENAILYLIQSRMKLRTSRNLCYTGGVALNAVANARLVSELDLDGFYLQPAAGDNGIALGAAFYGWFEVLKKQRHLHSQSTCFGMVYSSERIEKAIEVYRGSIDLFFEVLREGGSMIPLEEGIEVQFNVIGYGSFFVSKFDGRLVVRKQSGRLGGPSCIVTVSAAEFYRFLFQPDAFEQALREGSITATDPLVVSCLVASLDFLSLGNRLQSKLAEKMISGRVLAPRADAHFIRHTAELLASGKIVAWFQDEAEFGPRALGRRSILADPRLPNVRNFINREIKNREDFRPFAPAVLKEESPIYFQNGFDSPYMILVDQVRGEWRDKIKAVIHEDGSSRTQTVTKDWNRKFFELLHEFKKLTGLPMLLNTSLNCRGMPIVETPEEALAFFYSCRLDWLVIQDYVIGKDLPKND